MTTEFSHIPRDQIRIGADRARDIDAHWVETLAALIRAQGPITPISVRRIEGGYKLVAGMHRLAAFRLLDAEDIPCTVSSAETDDEAKLEEVMENLGRQELKALDRCHHLYQLKKVWERMYPETVHGGDRRSGKIKTQKVRLDPDAPQIFGFAKATAEKIGLSRRLIEQDVAIWKGLSPASRAALAGMPMAEKMTELKALSQQKPPRQAQILELIQSADHPDIQNVAEALFHLENGMTPNDFERRFLAARKFLSGLDEPLFDSVIAVHKERVIASLKRQGAI